MKKQTKLGLILAAAAVLSVSVASLVSAKGWVQEGGEWYYLDSNEERVTDTIQSSGTSKFYLSAEDGRMMKDYFLEDRDGQNYYFGQNGAMVTSTWVAVNSADVSNQGDYIPDNYWYYFQASGKAMKGGSGAIKKTTIDGKKYAFNDVGQMLTGWITEDGKVINPDDQTNPFVDALYYAGGDNDGVLRAGWVTYYDGYDSGEEWQDDKTNLYFYFNTTNNKKIGYGNATTKKINGKTYAFSNEGIMLSKWDAHYQYGGITGKVGTYFSGEDDGHQVKKGWVYAVPAQDIDQKAYNDDEEKYMYFGASGDITADQIKKINGKYYCFNENGIMKDGLVIWVIDHTTTGDTYKYASKLDFDYAEGSDVMKKGLLETDDGVFTQVNPDGYVVTIGGANAKIGDKITLHYFAADGSRKTGTNKVQFSDDQYDFASNASGMKGTGAFSKKYYSLGLLLKANADIRYGIYRTSRSIADGYAPMFDIQKNAWSVNVNNNGYEVLTTAGARQKGNDTAKKDADGNYWYIEKNSNKLKGIWTKNIRRKTDKFETYKINFANYYAFLVDKGISFTADPTSSTKFKVTDTLSLAFFSSVSTTDLNTLFPMDIDEVARNTTGAADSITGELDLTNADGSYKIRWNVNGMSWDSAGNVTFRDEVSFKNSYTPITSLWYQSDYGDSTNKWIPFGFRDAAGNTCYAEFGKGYSPYEVTPNNDYFLNCYWD